MYLALKCKPDNGTEIQNLANVALGIMIRLKIAESTEVNRRTSNVRSVGIQVVIHEYFIEVEQSVHDRALAGTIATEQQRDRPQVQRHSFADAFEVFN